jgi:hypothetical protein
LNRLLRLLRLLDLLDKDILNFSELARLQLK